MNPDWKQFLQSQGATFTLENTIDFSSPQSDRPCLYPIVHLAVLGAVGKDAAKLLQGQATCNVFEVTEAQARIGAFCNPKGRAIATFILAKRGDEFQLVLPLNQLDAVKTRLQKYVLRSDVKLTDRSADLCLFGADGKGEPTSPLFAARQEHGAVIIAMPGSRPLVVADSESAKTLWSAYCHKKNYVPAHSDNWRWLDLAAGLPWLSPGTAEEHVPQMLNLDRLNGISFTKGCYTGQEIVARTHYLGKAKRALFLAEVDSEIAPTENTPLFDRDGNEQSRGQVLAAMTLHGVCRILAVLLVSETDNYDLFLQDCPEATLRLLPLDYA